MIRIASMLGLALFLSAPLSVNAEEGNEAGAAALDFADTPAAKTQWSTGTAMIAPEGRWEFGLFHPLHWAVNDKVELSTHPVLTFVMPHINAKVLWYAHEGVYIATRHGLTYPSFMLRLLAKEGALGLLPAPTEVPEAIIIDSDFMLTYTLKERHWLTLELGFHFAPRAEGTMPVVDFPFLYPHFGVLSADGVLHSGLGFEGLFWEALGYRVEADFWWIPATQGGYAFEHTMALTWQFNEHVAITAGYRMSLARYPAGEQFHILPYGDLLFGF